MRLDVFDVTIFKQYNVAYQSLKDAPCIECYVFHVMSQCCHTYKTCIGCSHVTWWLFFIVIPGLSVFILPYGYLICDSHKAQLFYMRTGMLPKWWLYLPCHNIEVHNILVVMVALVVSAAR